MFSGILDHCNGKYSEFKKAVEFYLKQARNKLTETNCTISEVPVLVSVS